MKIKVCFILSLALLIGIMPMNLYAAADSKTAAVAQAKAPVTFQIKRNEIQIGVKDAVVNDIILREAEAGALKKNRVIYLQAETLNFESGAQAEVLSGDIKIKSVKTRDGILAIEIEKASSQASEIKITGLKLFLNRDLPQGSYGIDLITESGEDYPRNLFGDNYGDDDEPGKFHKRSVRLLDNFVILSDSGEITNEKWGESEYTSKIVMRVGKEEIIRNNRVVFTMEETPYETEETVMIPLRALAQVLNEQSIINWDQASQTITILFGSRVIQVAVGSNQMVVNGTKVTMSGEIELKNGSAFIPLQDTGIAFGIADNKIHWEAETKTITLSS